MMLPRGWVATTIGEISDTKLGKMLDKAKNSGMPTPYLRNVNVRWGAFDLTDLDRIRVTPAEAQELTVRDGDIFVCEGGEPGRSAVWSGGPSNLVFQKALHRVRLLGGSSADFVAARIRLAASHGELDHLLTGTTIKHLPQVALQRVGLDLPPAAEQRRIVAKLGALTARIAHARAELDRVPILTESLRGKALAEQFNRAGATAMLGELITDIRYGTAKKCDYGAGATPVLRIPNVQRGKIDLSDLKSADFDEKERAKLALSVGDVLVIRSNGSLDLVGKCAVVDLASAGLLYAGYLIRLRPNQRKLLPKYLHYFLGSHQTRQMIEGAARSSSGVNNVNAQQLQALRLPVASVEDQAKAIAKIESIFARADRLQAEASRARALLDRLESALLAKAFRGELVPQDPNDEPASVLLERIRAARAGAPKVKRGRKTAA